MNSKTLHLVLVSLLLGSLLASCAAPAAPTAAPVVPTAVPTQPPAATAAPAAAKSLKIAILLSTTSADSGWDATAYQGGQDAKQQLGAEVSVNENTTQSSAEAVVRDYASRGYNLIVVNDFGLGDVARKIAPEYPNVNFAITTGIWEAPNVSSYDPLQQDYFLSGCLDGLMTKTGKLGIMGGVEMPAMIRTANAIADGAKLCRPDINVSTAYVGSWADPAKAKELALAQIASGVDVIDGSVSVGYDGIIEAVKQAEKDGKTIYTVTDSVLKPDFIKQIMAAHTQDHGTMVMAYAKQVQDGTFKGGIFRPGLGSGLIYLKMTDTVPADIQAKVLKVQQDLIDGKITVNERFTK